MSSLRGRLSAAVRMASVALAILAVLSAFEHVSADNCPPESFGVCAVCKDTRDSNILGDLPRRDRSFSEVSGHFAAYSWWECEDDATGDRSCTMPNLPDEISDNENRAQYVDSLALYAAVSFLMFLFLIFWGCCMCYWRYCCCCCCRRSQRCKCGGKYPTRRTTLVGYSVQTGHVFAYSKGQRIMSCVFLSFFLILTSGWIALGYFNGTLKVFDSVKKLADSPSGAMSLGRSVAAPLSNTSISLAGLVMSPFLVDLNKTLTDAVDIPAVLENLQCTIDEIDAFPSGNELIGLVNDLDAGVNRIDGNLTGLQTAIDNLATANDTLILRINDAENAILDFQVQYDYIAGNVTQLNATIDSISALQAQFADPDTGIAVLSQEELIKVRDGYPTDTNFTDTDALLTDYRNGDLDGPAGTRPQQRGDLVLLLVDMQDSFDKQIPNLTETGELLREFNRQAEAAQNSALRSIFGDLDSAETALSSALNATELNNTVNALLDAVYAFDLRPINDSLLLLDIAINSFVDFDAARSLLQRVKDVRDVLPCIDVLVSQITTINETLVSVPDEADEVLELGTKLNDTLNPAIEQVDDAIVKLNDAEAEIDANDITVYTADVSAAQAEIDDGLASLDVTSIYASLDIVASSSADVDFSIRGDVEAFNDTLSTARVPIALIEALEDFEPFRVQLAANVTALLEDLLLLNQGYCNGDPTRYCEDDASCGADAPCVSIGTPRCQNDQTIACNGENAPTCGPAGSGNRCLRDNSRVVGVQFGLQSAQAARPNLDPAIDQLEQVKSDSSYDLKPLQSSLNTVAESSNDINYDDILSGFTDFRSSLTSQDIASQKDLISDLSGSLTSIDFSSLDSELTSFNETIFDFQTEQRNNLVDVQDATKAIHQIFFIDLHFHLRTLSPTNLRQVYASGGLTALALEIASVPDNITHVLNASLNDFNDPTTLEADLRDDNDTTLYLDLLSLQRYAIHGSLYWFGMMADDTKMIQPEEAGKGTVYKDENDNDWPDDKMCLTNACVEREIEKLEEEELGPLPLTYAQFSLALYGIPGIVILLGVWGLICSACCCKSSPSWQKVPLSWMTGCIFVQASCIFLFMTIFFTLLLFLGDVCTGGRHIGVQYYDKYSDPLCLTDVADLSSYVETSGSYEACAISITFGDDPEKDPVADVTLNLHDIIAGVLLGCPAQDPITPLFDAIAEAVDDYPRTPVENFLEDNDKETFVIRQPVRDLMMKAANNTGVVASYTTRDVGAILTCPALYTAINNVPDTFCCENLDALYWVIASWYLIAWSMCLCGCCAGTLARKRLPSRPWGEHIKQDESEVPHTGVFEVLGSPSGLIPAKEISYDTRPQDPNAPNGNAGAGPGAGNGDPNAPQDGFTDPSAPQFNNESADHHYNPQKGEDEETGKVVTI